MKIINKNEELSPLPNKQPMVGAIKAFWLKEWRLTAPNHPVITLLIIKLKNPHEYLLKFTKFRKTSRSFRGGERRLKNKLF